MRGIIYDQKDEDLIQVAGNFFAHMLECPDCRHRAQTTTDPIDRMAIDSMWDQLDALVAEPLDRTDYEDGLRLCKAWLTAHITIMLVPFDDGEIQVVLNDRGTLN